MSVFVFGGGAWGRALAFAFSLNHKVYILSRRKIDLPNVKQISLDELEFFFNKSENPLCVLSIASPFVREYLENNKAFLVLRDRVKIMCASKGIDRATSSFMCDLLQNFFKKENICYLSGPSFAKEIMQSLPCALNISAYDLALGSVFADLFPNFIKIYVKSDVIGSEVAGSYKNVIAIACGICDALLLGNNAKASLLARGLVEMARFGQFFGASIETFLGLSGSGDLFLTSNSSMSRNYRVGQKLAQNESLSDILSEIAEVAEGVHSAYSINQIARDNNLYCPIAFEVYEILQGKDVRKSVEGLLKKSEYK